MLLKRYPNLSYSVQDTTIFITIGSVLEVNKQIEGNKETNSILARYGTNVKAYEKFWNNGDVNTNANTVEDVVVPPLLVYADLMNTNDRRCIETAQKIYDGFIQNKL